MGVMNLPQHSASVVCIVGALVFGLTKDKPQVLGLHMFWCGMLAVLLSGKF